MDVFVLWLNFVFLFDSRNIFIVSDGFFYSILVLMFFIFLDELNLIDLYYFMGGGVFDFVDFDGIGCGLVDLVG